MTNKRKQRTRALKTKLSIHYQTAHNICEAGRRAGSAAEPAPMGGEDARGPLHAEEGVVDALASVSQDTPNSSAAPPDEREAAPAWHGTMSRNEVIQYAHPDVVMYAAGWSSLLGGPGAGFLIRAVARSATEEGIEREIAPLFGGAKPMTLRRTRLPRTGARNVAQLAATARLVGHQPPTTFGDLLRLLVRLGVVTQNAGKYEIVFPPPIPEETLTLTLEQLSGVMWFRKGLEPGTGGMESVKEAVLAEGPGFVPPAWLSEVLDTDRDAYEYRRLAFGPGDTRVLIGAVKSDPALNDQINRHFFEYLAETPDECPCGAQITDVSRIANSPKAGLVLIEVLCARGHFGYANRRIEDVCPVDSPEASVELFLQGRPDKERILVRDLYTEYALWGLTRNCRPVSTVKFGRRVMSSELYRRLDWDHNGRIYVRLPSKGVAQTIPRT